MFWLSLDVYGGDKTGYKREIPKDPIYYMRQGPVSDISSASSADHSRLRRMLAPLFSQRAVTLQENYLRQHIALFIARLARPNQKQEGRRSGVVNLTHWLNLLTTDVICELTFGETFGGLDNGKLHPWLDSVFWIFKISSFIREVNHWPTFARKALICCVPRRILQGQQAVISFCEDATARRMQQDPGRPDFMSHILEKTGGERMTKTEAELAALTLIIAGSETVATMLSGTVYLLCTNPRVLRDLTERIRADFRQESDLNLVNLQHHQFLNATILECLRLYPPAPDSLFRRTIASETIIMGRSVPPQTCVTMNLWAANRSAFNFHRPNEMVPERWTKPCPKEFQDDDRDVMRPFSVGQRDCLGKNLAWAEMRMILAYMLWHFDLELHPASKDWIDKQKVFMLWQKPDLMVKMLPRSLMNAQLDPSASGCNLSED
ncbi:isotrichodermin C-15 hydroxylase [Aspergillus lentulus]|nr:isotrichodermin C-15 hydroxylase [Aspergillus lentulus]